MFAFLINFEATNDKIIHNKIIKMGIPQTIKSINAYTLGFKFSDEQDFI